MQRHKSMPLITQIETMIIEHLTLHIETKVLPNRSLCNSLFKQHHIILVLLLFYLTIFTTYKLYISLRFARMHYLMSFFFDVLIIYIQKHIYKLKIWV